MEIEEYIENTSENNLNGGEVEHYKTDDNNDLVIYSSKNPIAWIKSDTYMEVGDLI